MIRAHGLVENPQAVHTERDICWLPSLVRASAFAMLGG